MEFLLSPAAYGPLLLGAAFLGGLLAFLVKLPPLVGFIVAGVVLRALGLESTDNIRDLADLGVTVLMFTIGLKLRVKSLLSPVVWAGTTLHLTLSTALFLVVAMLLGASGLSQFAELNWQSALLLAFALSFSSTVFAIKTLDQRGESHSPHGVTAVGMLIMQDMIAVVFLTVSLGKVPSPWAVLLLLLLPLRRPLQNLLDKSGHGDLLVACGLFLGLFVGAFLFSLVGLKPDLGALMVGALVAGHAKAKELADVLMGFKEVLLIAFFLNIGLSEPISTVAVVSALLLTLVLPVKSLLYFLTMTLFRLPARQSFLSTVALSNFSEFGLIVAAVGVQLGLISGNWLVVLALALTFTFLLASPLNRSVHELERRFRRRLESFESKKVAPRPVIEAATFDVIILGMGRIGEGAYDELDRLYDRVLGIDFDATTVERHQAAARKVKRGDPTDDSFWESLRGIEHVSAIVFAMPEIAIHRYVFELLGRRGYTGYLFVAAHYPEEVAMIQEMGATGVYVFQEAGAGLASHVHETLESSQIPETLSRVSVPVSML